MQLSSFGEKFTAHSGILQLMDDLGNALAINRDMLMLGGGNPSHIPAVQQQLRQRMTEILANADEFERMVGNYDTSQGHPAFIKALAKLLQREYGWSVQPENILLTNGSQSAFFGLFNLLAGHYPDGSHKKILLPLAPEYIGYADVGVADDIFVANKPEFEWIDAHTFKYHVDFDRLTVDDDIAALCVSRPTNPTGNVLTDTEVADLRTLAAQRQIPFIIDAAYGAPFPNIIYTEVQPVWDEQLILCLSLSKLGLPGVRTGIVIAQAQMISALIALNAIMNLAPNSSGAVLALDWIRSGEILRLSRETIQPYYQAKVTRAVAEIRQALAGTPYALHKPEGAFFLWLWFKDLPITTQTLYERLKQRGVLIIPSQHFFPGIDNRWQHCHECIRVSYAQDDAVVAAGIRIIGEEVKRAYAEFR